MTLYINYTIINTKTNSVSDYIQIETPLKGYDSVAVGFGFRAP